MTANENAKRAEQDIIETARSDGDFDTLVELTEIAEIDWVLKFHGPFTLLGPTDEAFDKLPPEDLKKLRDPANKKELRTMLARHIYTRDQINGMTVDELLKPKSFTTWSGRVHTWPTARELWLYDQADTPVVRAKFVKEDLRCANGYLHGIDDVLYLR